MRIACACGRLWLCPVQQVCLQSYLLEPVRTRQGLTRYACAPLPRSGWPPAPSLAWRAAATTGPTGTPSCRASCSGARRTYRFCAPLCSLWASGPDAPCIAFTTNLTQPLTLPPPALPPRRSLEWVIGEQGPSRPVVALVGRRLQVRPRPPCPLPCCHSAAAGAHHARWHFGAARHARHAPS